MAETQKRNIVFMGTPAFAATVLRYLLREDNLAVAGVFTKPDSKTGRGMKTGISAVKELALQYDLPLWQPKTLRSQEVEEIMRELKPDFIISASYGLILPQNILDQARIAPLNVHASLLPKYRGAAPIQRAIMENWGPDAKTGVTIMKMEAGLDTGPVYSALPVAIGRKNQAEISAELAEKGGQLLVQTIQKILNENLLPEKQVEQEATHAAMLVKEDGRINWNLPTLQVDALVRAVTPWPGATAIFEVNEEKTPVTILECQPDFIDPCAQPGTVRIKHGALRAACSDGWLRIDKLKPQGRKAMLAADFINGLRGAELKLANYA